MIKRPMMLAPMIESIKDSALVHCQVHQELLAAADRAGMAIALKLS